MTANLGEAREAIARCRQLRQNGAIEAVLRGEFQSRLRSIFPNAEDERWINHYSEGTETHTKIELTAEMEAHRFIDNLVGSTTIEYEADLRDTAKRDEGYRQVKEHATGLIRSGIKVSQVRGILSDTVDWHVYDVKLRPGVEPSTSTPDDIELVEVETFEPSVDNHETAEHFILFLRRHLAREQSRPLIAVNLAFDLGLDSATYRRNFDVLAGLLEAGRRDDPSISLATDLWSHFVDHLEGEGGQFRVGPYVDEVYLNLLARLLSANALARTAIMSEETELRSILDGTYFENEYQIDNLVEQDYFGWLTKPAHIPGVLPVAHEIQRDLYAYDFNMRAEEDLFGRLMAQLASRSQRKLLGQEWTPGWLARRLADRCLADLPENEAPEIVDMCCGSGAILAEVINAAKDRYGYTEITDLQNVVTGFDIDPLAVTFAKTTWIITLTSEINSATEPVTIPVYHADSLFAVTPVSASVPMLGESDTIDIALDGETILLPAKLIQPEFRELFDLLVDWAYDEACDNSGTEPTSSDVRTTLDMAATASNVTLSLALRESIIDAILQLALRMKSLADTGRNGIWAFILRNTYRPGILTGQFNGLVSNPPWLAMSTLADNPYRNILTRRAELYGIRPTGQSFLHLELGTMHLLHAIDRYLKPEAAVACLVPGTIFNGHHHERFRKRGYINSDRPAAFAISEVWQVVSGTFKYPGAALIGRKVARLSDADKPVASGAVVKPTGVDPATFAIRQIGDTRTAWALEMGGYPAAAAGSAEVSQQGADIMPRGAVCIEILSATGNEYRVDTPTHGSTWGFTVKQVMELRDESFPGYVAPRFIHYMAQSENLLPFVLGAHRAPIAIPATRDETGVWQVYEPAEIRRMGFLRTSRRFASINARLINVGSGHTLEYRIDVRRKLDKQVIGNVGSVVLSGAGGTYICAACIPATEARQLVIDQTLYWQLVLDEDEAWFKTGILNSRALTEAILPFNPKGNFGPRHIHTLPYRIMPTYSATNAEHRAIADNALAISAITQDIIDGDTYIGNPNTSLAGRRRKLREYLLANERFQHLEYLCRMVLGIDSGG